jgi:lipopolysaccharide transport system ATP-binding protein
VQEGRTVLFVSHNMAAIASLCTRALLIEGGRLELSNSPQTVIEKYLSKSQANAGVSLLERKDRKGRGRLRFTKVSVLNDRMEAIDTVTSGQDISIALDYDIHDHNTLYNAVVQIKFSGILGQPLFACLSGACLRDPLALFPGARLLCKIPRLPLSAGLYMYTVWCTVSGNLEDHVAEAGKLEVVEGDFFGTGKFPARNTGDFLVAHHWSVEGKTQCYRVRSR